MFNFLELNDSYLENAILRDLQQLNLFFLNERWKEEQFDPDDFVVTLERIQTQSSFVVAENESKLQGILMHHWISSVYFFTNG